MRPHHQGCLAPVRPLSIARRLFALVLPLILGLPLGAFAADGGGRVVDQDGRPLPRARVRIVTTDAAGGGRHVSDMFADIALQGLLSR